MVNTGPDMRTEIIAILITLISYRRYEGFEV